MHEFSLALTEPDFPVRCEQMKLIVASNNPTYLGADQALFHNRDMTWKE